jgi:hypothetical protein
VVTRSARSRLARASGTDVLTGKIGSFRINRVGEITNVGDGHRNYSGTWSLDIYTPTRQYRGFLGGGRLTAVEFPDGHAIYPHEGFFTKS